MTFAGQRREHFVERFADGDDQGQRSDPPVAEDAGDPVERAPNLVGPGGLLPRIGEYALAGAKTGHVALVHALRLWVPCTDEPVGSEDRDAALRADIEGLKLLGEVIRIHGRHDYAGEAAIVKAETSRGLQDVSAGNPTFQGSVDVEAPLGAGLQRNEVVAVANVEPRCVCGPRCTRGEQFAVFVEQ